MLSAESGASQLTFGKMISQSKAEELILKLVNEAFENGHCKDKFVIQSTRLSEREDYWIITSNSEAFVLRNDFSKCYVGVSAHLVHRQTGDIETVGSGQDLDEFLENKYDEAEAGERFWVLMSDDASQSKSQFVAFRQFTAIPLVDVKWMLSNNAIWLTGKKRNLTKAMEILRESGIQSSVALVDELPAVPKLVLYGYQGEDSLVR